MNTTIIGVYKKEELLISALKKINEKKIEIIEVITPYPIHEVFKILQQKTRLPIVTFLFAIIGLVSTYLFLYWTSIVSYPLVYGGKPLHSIPSFIVISYEMMIFFGIVFSVIAFLIRSKLYPSKKAKIYHLKLTDNAFGILIDKKPEMSSSDIKTINSILKENGAVEVFEKEIK